MHSQANVAQPDKWDAVHQWPSENLGQLLACWVCGWNTRDRMIALIKEYVEQISKMLDEVKVTYIIQQNVAGIFGKPFEPYQLQRVQDALDGLASMEEDPWLDFLHHLLVRPIGVIWQYMEPIIEISPFRGQMLSAFTIFLPEPNKPYTRGYAEQFGGHTVADLLAAKGVEFPDGYDTDYLVLAPAEVLPLIRVIPRAHLQQVQR